MTDEEKNVIDLLKNIDKQKCLMLNCPVVKNNIERQLKIIELNRIIRKQSKEIEELKEDNTELKRTYLRTAKHQENIGHVELAHYMLAQIQAVPTFTTWEDYKTWVDIDKIKEILGIEEETDSEKILSLLQTIVDENDRLEDIEDRKVQIEYNNVFNKGVKSVEDKIKAKIGERMQKNNNIIHNAKLKYGKDYYWYDDVQEANRENDIYKDVLKSLLEKE